MASTIVAVNFLKVQLWVLVLYVFIKGLGSGTTEKLLNLKATRLKNREPTKNANIAISNEFHFVPL
jgi:hypothetical protein